MTNPTKPIAPIPHPNPNHHEGVRVPVSRFQAGLCAFNVVLATGIYLLHEYRTPGQDISKIEGAIIGAALSISGVLVGTIKIEQVVRRVGHYLANGQNTIALAAGEAAVEAKSTREQISKIEEQTNGKMAQAVGDEVRKTGEMIPLDRVQAMLKAARDESCNDIARKAAMLALEEFRKQNERPPAVQT